ncbi:MAG TPA: LytR C-terminal domain-containing protein [Sporichthya sp.]|nr:LytR C-terminal domain-containing protein [Sporichthya sp.]
MIGEPRRGGSLLSTVASSALAALAVIVLVGVLILAFGQDGDEADQLALDGNLVATLAPPGTPPATPQAQPSATPSPTPSATPSPTPSATPTSPPSATPTVERVPLVVLNQTGVSGLAAQFQKRLEAAGWTVSGVDDFRGNVPATTVYFPPGLRPVAKALMAEFPEIGRIRPAFRGISTTQLTVILGKDFPTSQ